MATTTQRRSKKKSNDSSEILSFFAMEVASSDLLDTAEESLDELYSKQTILLPAQIRQLMRILASLSAYAEGVIIGNQLEAIGEKENTTRSSKPSCRKNESNSG